MDLIYIITIVVMTVIIYKQHNEIAEIKNKMKDLDYKLFYNYNLIKNMNNKQNGYNGNRQDKEHSGTSVHPTATGNQAPLSVRLSSVESVVRPAGNRVPNTPMQPKPAGSQVPNTPMQPKPAGSQVPNTPVQPKPAGGQVPNTPMQPKPAGNRVPNTPVQPVFAKNYTPYSDSKSNVNKPVEVPAEHKTTSNQSVQKPVENKKGTFESWLGSRVFNVIASLLIFIGFILLGTLDLPVSARIASMYLSSGWLIAFGTVLTKRFRNYFSLGLTGCGCGALFISILLTHIYFHAIPDIAAFSLLVVWTALTLFISKKFDSVLLSATAHAGMAISVCFAFSMGFSSDKLLLPVIYQIVSIATVVVGNIFCCRKTYRFGLIVSMLIMMYSSVVMYNSLSGLNVSSGVVAILFVVQLLGSSFLSYLLAVTATKFSAQSAKSSEQSQQQAKKDIGLLAHLANKTVWCVSTFINIWLVFKKIFFEYSFNKQSAALGAILILAAVVIAHTVITVFLSEKLNFNTTLANTSIYFLSALMSIALIMSAIQRNVTGGHLNASYIFLVAAGVIVVMMITGNKILTYCAITLLSIDGFIMIFGGYKSLSEVGTVALSFGYMILISAMIVYIWMLQTKEDRDGYFTLFKSYIYFWVNLSVISIFTWNFEDKYFALPLILTVISVIHILLHTFSYGKNSMLEYVIRCASVIILCFSFFFIGSTRSYFDFIYLYVILLIAAAGLFAVRAKDWIKSDFWVYHVLTGLVFTIFVCSVFNGYTNIMSTGCFASLIFMTAALVCIVADLKWEKDGLKFYGIAVTIISVFKIVFIDISSASSFETALALILSSVICLLLHIISLKKETNSIFKYIVLGVSGVILYASFIVIGGTKHHFELIVLYVILLIVTAGLFAVKAYECVKSKFAVLQAIIGLTFTVFVGCIFNGYTNIMSTGCFASLIFMTAALVCIVADLKWEKDGLKFYGLAVIAFFVIKLVSADMIFADGFQRALSLTLGCTVFLVLHILSLKKDCGQLFNNTVLGSSGVMLYASFAVIGITKDHMDFMTVYMLLFLVTAGLFTVKAYGCIKSKSVVLQVLSGISFTVFVHAVAYGYSDILLITYIASIIYMITALLCIALGFKLKAKGLRLYGLVIVIVCVLKLVTIDVRSANSMARVTAFIVGGVICFAISGIYNRVERLYADKK